MKFLRILRWVGIAANGAIVLAAVISLVMGASASAALIVSLVPLLSLWALIPLYPKTAMTLLVALTNALLLVAGVFAVYGLGEYVQSRLHIAIISAGAAIVPGINVLVLLWRFSAARSNNSFKPNPLRGSA